MDKNKRDKYLAGYTTPPRAESPGPKKGDPQRSALIQYLLDKLVVASTGLKENGTTPLIVDFGSGGGVLAEELERLLPPNAQPPMYVAVDLPEPLRLLALPPRMHNQSQKCGVSEFYSDFLPKHGKSISMIVLRNVLHEMDIYHTAELFSYINQFTRNGTELYIQDIAILPEHERGKAGWNPEQLCEFLSAIGIESSMAKQESYQGTEWFILSAKLIGSVTDLRQIEEYCAACRRKQHDGILSKIELLNQTTDEASATRLIQLQGECTSISVQLRQWDVSIGHDAPRTQVSTKLAGLGIHIAAEKLAAYDFVVETSEQIHKLTGLVAILSGKSILDFPALYRSCRREILFSGYSQRLLFQNEDNRDSLREVLLAGRKVQILLVDPSSEAAALRASSPSYSQPSELIGGIIQTIEASRSFNREPGFEGPAGRHCSIEVGLSHRPPPCSYFFVDDKCFVSLYSDRMTGSRGPCLVYIPITAIYGSYFHFLLEDFRSEWGRCSRVSDE